MLNSHSNNNKSYRAHATVWQRGNEMWQRRAHTQAQEQLMYIYSHVDGKRTERDRICENCMLCAVCAVRVCLHVIAKIAHTFRTHTHT